MRKPNMSILVAAAVCFAVGPACSPAGAAAGEPVALSEALGPEIDTEERQAYHLFPGIEGFISARFLGRGSGRYSLQYNYRDETGTHERTKRLSAALWDDVNLHVRLVESYSERRLHPPDTTESEAEWQYRMALKYAARGRYDLSRVMIEDLFADFPSSRAATDATSVRSAIGQLARTRRALFLPGPLYDRGGRTDVLIFSGYYGVWLGIATPAALSAESEQAYGLALILGVPVSIGVAKVLTARADLSRGRASMISLGGHLGTWQGIGWAALADREAEGVLGAGILAGLAGITAAALLTRNADVTEGHGALSGLSLPWGMWFGLVVAEVAELDGDAALRAVLLTSDAVVLGTLAGARNASMSRGRARLISLAGVGGTMVGLGIALIAEVEEGRTAMALAGLGSAFGLAVGTRATSRYDAGKELAGSWDGGEDRRWAVTPSLDLKPHPFRAGRIVPSLSLRLRF